MLRRIVPIRHRRAINRDRLSNVTFNIRPAELDDRTEATRTRLAGYGPADTIVLFSGKRLNFGNIGHQFWEDGNMYADILEAASNSYGKYVFKYNDFRALSVINLAMNLCSYRKFYEENPTQFNTVKAAVGFGLGEMAALVVSGMMDTKDAFEIINYHSNEVQKMERKHQSTVAVVKGRLEKIHLALHDARQYVAKVKGFDLEDTLLVPHHVSYGVPTTGSYNQKCI